MRKKYNMIKVLVADDHPLIRKGIRQILKKVTDITVKGEASTGYEVLIKVRKNRYDIVLLDIAMPGISGLETLEELKKENPKIRVLILSMYPEEQFAIRAIRAGAFGYLSKNSVPDELVEAIRRISQGLRYITPSMLEMLADEIGQENTLPHQKLSNREYQVLLLISSGKKLREISEELSLSSSTISTYRARVLDKMHMSTNAALINYVVRNELN